MLDGIAILLCPFLIVPIVSIILAYMIECLRRYIHQRRRRRQQNQIEYFSIIILSSNDQDHLPAYETLFFEQNMIK
jgi:hypothetical protein